MPDDPQESHASPHWRPGSVREIIIAAAERLTSCEIDAPPFSFYETLADRAEEIADEAIAEAINAQDAKTMAANIRIARRLVHEIGDEIFLATEQSADVNLARLAAYFLLEGNDGYSDLIYDHFWGAQGGPKRGTVWSMHQDIRDLTPAFIFKVCLRGDVRFLGVECHAPIRRLPGDPHARIRARTMIISGVPILAFSPAEIETDPAGCVFEVNGALAVLAQELLALHNIDRPPRRDFRPTT